MVSKFSDVKDQELMSLLSNNNLAAWSELINRYSRLVYAIAFQVLKNDSDSEDAVQNSFIRLKAYANKFDCNQPLTPWLSRIACSEAIRIYKKKKYKEKNDTLIIKTRENEKQSDLKTIIDVAEQKEMIGIVNQALNLLPEVNRMALTLYYAGGLSQTEIAQELGLSQVSISAKIKTGLEKVKFYLNQYGVQTTITLLPQLIKESFLAVEIPKQFVQKLMNNIPNETHSPDNSTELSASTKPITSKSFILWSIYIAGVTLISLLALTNFIQKNNQPNNNSFNTTKVLSKVFKPVNTTHYTPFYYGRGKTPKDIDIPDVLVDGLVQYRGGDKKWSFQNDKKGSSFTRTDLHRTNDVNGFYLNSIYDEPAMFKGTIKVSDKNGLFGFIVCSTEKNNDTNKSGELGLVEHTLSKTHYIEIANFPVVSEGEYDFKVFIWKHNDRWHSATIVTDNILKTESIFSGTLKHNQMAFQFGVFSNCILRCNNFVFCNLGHTWDHESEEILKKLYKNLDKKSIGKN